MNYFDQDGKRIILGDQLGKGASATIYRDKKNSNRAIKIYNPAHLAKEPSLKKRLLKLKELSEKGDFEISLGGKKRCVGAFPKGLVQDENKQLRGFTMDSFDNGVDLTQIIYAKDPKTAFYKYSVKGSAYQSQDHYNNWIDSFLYSRKGLRNRFVLSYTLAQFFAKFYEIKEKSSLRRFDLECTNFDLKPENVLVRLEHDNITGSRLIVPFILDLDNLTLRNNLNTLGPASPNITPEYMAPEGPTSRYYDNFSLGVILYQVLVGIHPFEGIAGVSRFRDGTERNYFMKNRCFPGGKNGPFLSCASEHQRFEKMPEILKKLFRRALDAQEPSARPTPREWQMALAGVLSDPALDFSNLFELPDLGQPTSLLTAPRTPPSLNIPILNTQVAKLLAGAKNKICAILA